VGTGGSFLGVKAARVLLGWPLTSI
jgi:hypothetical protein